MTDCQCLRDTETTGVSGETGYFLEIVPSLWTAVAPQPWESPFVNGELD